MESRKQALIAKLKQLSSSSDSFTPSQIESFSPPSKIPRFLINSLTKEDYTLFYEASVWDDYEDLVYAISRGKADEAI